MMIYFSASTCGFYNSQLLESYKKADKWPDDAKPITQSVFLQFHGEPPSGKQRGADENGQPCWVNLPEPTEDQKKVAESATIRTQRDTIVERVSREINRLEDKNLDSSAWRTYREQLRNVPEQDGFPFDITWPEQPADYTGK